MFKRFALPLAPLALSCALAFPGPAVAAVSSSMATPESAREALLSNVRFLISKGRSDLARAVINQVLAIQSDDADTLVLFGDLELRAGRSANAQKVLERLQALDPKSAATREMEALMRLYTVDRGRLTQLRTLHDAGQYAQAQVIARELFPDGKAPGSLDREFADVLRAKPILEPRQPGMIVGHPAIGSRLTKGLRGTASSGSARGGTLSKSLARGGGPGYRPSGADVALASAYDALDAADLVRAEEGFRRVLRLRANSAPAWGGLGIVRARQGQHAEALRLYGQAQQRERNRRSTTWLELANTSAYWLQIDQARSQLAQRQFAEARQSLRKALLRDPQESEAAVLLAQTDLEQEQFEVAERAFRALIPRVPTDARVWRGLLSSVLRQPGYGVDGIEQLWAEVDEAARVHGVGGPALIDVGVVRALARRQLDRGDPTLAATTLDRALRWAPADPWLRHDRARLHLDQGQLAQANRMMREGVNLAPDDPEMRHASAIIALAQDQELTALETLDAVPERDRTSGMRSLAENARFELLMRRLTLAGDSGARRDLEPLLLEARQLVGEDAGRQLRLARVQLRWQQSAEAAALLDRIDLNRLSSQDRVAHALLLSDLGRHDEALKALGAQVSGWPTTLPPGPLVAAQLQVAGREIDGLMALGRADEALQVAESALADWRTRSPLPAVVASAQSSLWLQAKAEGRALASADEALALEPANATALLTRARIRAALGNREGARTDLTALDRVLPAAAVEERLQAVQIWTALGDRVIARQWLAPLLSRQPGSAALRLEAARIARLDQDYVGALQHLRYVSGLQPVTPNLMSVTMGASESLAAAGSPNDPRSLASVREAIAAIEARRQPRFEVAAYGFGNGGDPGTSKIRGQEWTAALYWPVNYQGHVFGQIDRVRLDAGVLPALNSQAREFGQVAALSGGADLPAGVGQQADGYSVGVGWVDEKRRIDLGVVGVGLGRSNVTGGWREDLQLGGQDAVLEVSRRVETRSLLTYGGAEDPMTGRIWGGITNNSVALRFDRDVADRWQQALTARLGWMAGRHVEDNPYLQLQGRWTRVVRQSSEATLRTGWAVNLWHYQHNSSGYTYGQGGYYSPQTYASVQVPFDLSGSREAWSYALRGSLTYSWAREASAPFYPLDPVLQAAAGDPQRVASTNHGLGVSLRGLAEYKVNPYWSVGGTAEWDRARDYRPYRVGLYLRHYFDGASAPSPVPPRPVLPYAQF